MDECIRKFPQSFHAGSIKSYLISFHSQTSKVTQERLEITVMKHNRLFHMHDWDLSVYSTEQKLSEFPLFQHTDVTERTGLLLSAGIATNCKRGILYLLPSLPFAHLSHLLYTAAPRWTNQWQRPSSLATVAAPLGDHSWGGGEG